MLQAHLATPLDYLLVMCLAHRVLHAVMLVGRTQHTCVHLPSVYPGMIQQHQLQHAPSIPAPSEPDMMTHSIKHVHGAGVLSMSPWHAVGRIRHTNRVLHHEQAQVLSSHNPHCML